MTEDGYIYVLAEEGRSRPVKIGRTGRDPETRAKELSRATGVPRKLEVVASWKVRDHHNVEHAAHEALNSSRIAKKEWFELDVDAACDTVARVCGPFLIHPGPSHRNWTSAATSISAHLDHWIESGCPPETAPQFAEWTVILLSIASSNGGSNNAKDALGVLSKLLHALGTHFDSSTRDIDFIAAVLRSAATGRPSVDDSIDHRLFDKTLSAFVSQALRARPMNPDASQGAWYIAKNHGWAKTQLALPVPAREHTLAFFRSILPLAVLLVVEYVLSMAQTSVTLPIATSYFRGVAYIVASACVFAGLFHPAFRARLYEFNKESSLSSFWRRWYPQVVASTIPATMVLYGCSLLSAPSNGAPPTMGQGARSSIASVQRPPDDAVSSESLPSSSVDDEPAIGCGSPDAARRVRTEVSDWEDWQCASEEHVSRAVWSYCLHFGKYNAPGLEACPGTQRCCAPNSQSVMGQEERLRALSRSACGQPAVNAHFELPVLWQNYRCRSPHSPDVTNPNDCLPRSAYSTDVGTGCIEGMLCCPTLNSTEL